MKLICYACGQDSDPICSDADHGSNPDWSPDDDQDHESIARDAPEPPPPQKRRKTDDPLCSDNDGRVVERDGIFFPLQTHSMLMIMSKNM